MAQTLCMNGAQESMAGITVFPHEMIKRQKISFDKTGHTSEYVVVTGLVDVLGKCYESWQLPSERGISWAKAGRRVDLSAYAWYPEKTQGQTIRKGKILVTNQPVNSDIKKGE